MKTPAELRSKAAYYRQLASGARHPEARDALLLLAREYESEADSIEEGRPGPDPAGGPVAH